MNKIFAFISIICFIIMAGLSSYFGNILPNTMTIGKFMTIFLFVIYEIVCIISFIYFWFKK